MTAYTTRMPAGFAGRVSRSDSKTIEQQIPDGSTPPTVYGTAVKMVSGKLKPMGSGDAASLIYGLLVNPYPMQSTTNTAGAATPPTTGVLDVMRRGYMTVALKLGTAAKAGQVYIVTTAGGTVVIGDVVTASSPAGGGTAVALANGFFMGAADSNGVVEIQYNI